MRAGVLPHPGGGTIATQCGSSGSRHHLAERLLLHRHVHLVGLLRRHLQEGRAGQDPPEGMGGDTKHRQDGTSGGIRVMGTEAVTGQKPVHAIACNVYAYSKL